MLLSGFFNSEILECKRVQSVIDKFNENEIILDFEILKRKFDIHMNLSTYMGVRQAVLSNLRKYIFNSIEFVDKEDSWRK